MKVRRSSCCRSFIAKLCPSGCSTGSSWPVGRSAGGTPTSTDLRTLVAHGSTGVVDGWLTTIITAMENGCAETGPFDHKLVPELLPSYLEELAAIKACRAELNTETRLRPPPVTRRTTNPTRGC